MSWKIVAGLAAALLLTGAGIIWTGSMRNSGMAAGDTIVEQGCKSTAYELTDRWKLNDKLHADVPDGVAVDAQGHIFVDDFGANCVYKMDGHGNLLSKWGSPGHGEGQFSSPCGIEVAATGDILVSDNKNCRVEKFDNNGKFLQKIALPGTPPPSFRPASTITDPYGNIYVSAMLACSVTMFSSNGTVLLTWGRQGMADGEFTAPFNIARDPAGNIFVADDNNHTVQKFTPHGKFLDKWPVGNIWGMTVDTAGNVYVSSVDTHCVIKYTNDGKEITKLPVYCPEALVVDQQGKVYVLNVTNRKPYICELLIFRPQSAGR